MIDRVPRCKSAKKQGFNLLFTHACHCKEIAERRDSGEAIGAVDAREHLHPDGSGYEEAARPVAVLRVLFAPRGSGRLLGVVVE